MRETVEKVVAILECDKSGRTAASQQDFEPIGQGADLAAVRYSKLMVRFTDVLSEHRHRMVLLERFS